MRQMVSTSIIALLALVFMIDDAEAGRLGGGRSLGAQRSTVAPSRKLQQTPPTLATPAAPAANPTAAPEPAGNRWLGPIAGLTPGLA